MINLNKLPVYLDEAVEFDKSYYEGTVIKDLKDVHVKGYFKDAYEDDVEIYLDVDGIMVLNDSVTNEFVDYPFSFKIDANLSEILEENAKYYQKNENILDNIEFLWENIVLEVPISFTRSSNIELSGNGWCLNNDFKGGE